MAVNRRLRLKTKNSRLNSLVIISNDIVKNRFFLALSPYDSDDKNVSYSGRVFII